MSTSCIGQFAIASDIVAPIDTLNSLTDACQKTSSEEQVTATEKQQFELDCINAQLIEMGYQRQKLQQQLTENIETEPLSQH